MPQFYLKVHQNTFGESTWGAVALPLAQGPAGSQDPQTNGRGEEIVGREERGRQHFTCNFTQNVQL